MRIGFDVTPLTMPRSGVGRYAAQLLGGLRTAAPEHEYHLLTHRPLLDQTVMTPAEDGPGDRSPPFPVKALWLQTVLPLWLRRADFDLCHYTNYVAPLHGPRSAVVTFHDMSLFLVPQHCLPRDTLIVRPLLPLIARRARAIITVSQSARRDLLRILRVPPDRVHVVYEAAGPEFRPIDDRGHLDAVAAHYDLAPGYLLYVGTIEPRKNLVRVVEALHRLHRAGLRRPLIVVGRPGWKNEALLARIEALGLEREVRFLGYVPDDDLPALYNLAGAFLFPSLYEGFGLPVVEAMACGVPVVTANVASTAEIARGAALLVDPLRCEEIADAAAALCQDGSLRERLVSAGRARAGEFSWARTARETAAIYAAAATA